MKQFISFIHKEFLHIFRDSRTMLVLLLMPVVLICLFGYAVTNETKNSRIAIADESKSDVVRQITERINANPYFTVTHIVNNAAETEPLFANSQIDVAVVFPNGFPSEALRTKDLSVQILVDGSEPNQASVRSSYLQQILLSSLSENISTVKPRIAVQTRLLYNPQAKSEYNFVPGVIGMILMLICAMMTSISIVREKELGTMEILLSSPLHPLVILIAKLIPYFVVSSVNVVSILLLSKYAMGVPVSGNVFVFCGITLIYILVSLSLGMLISTAVDTQLAAMLLSLLLIVPTIYISGMVFPIESMPFPVQKLSVVVPARWYIDAARKLMIQGVDSFFVIKDAAILAIQAIVLLSISLKLFKTRLQ